MTTTTNNNSINNNVKFYTLDGEQVFLAERCEMDALGINPINKWSVDSFVIAAYSASDYQQGIDTRMTFLEDYAGGYADDNDEIYLGKVVNPENGNIIDSAWILESDRRDVYDELNDHAYLDSEEEQVPHYYTINGVKVFLANKSDMQGVEPYEVNSQLDINAYRLEDYRNGVDTEETYYESYGGSYDDGLEICIANVVNVENEQHVLFSQWICVDELDDVKKEIESRGFDEDIYGTK